MQSKKATFCPFSFIKENSQIFSIKISIYEHGKLKFVPVRAILQLESPKLERSDSIGNNPKILLKVDTHYDVILLENQT